MSNNQTIINYLNELLQRVEALEKTVKSIDPKVFKKNQSQDIEIQRADKMQNEANRIFMSATGSDNININDLLNELPVSKKLP